MTTEIKDLGTMNGWKENGVKWEMVRNCWKENHQLVVTNLGNCHNRHTCETCKITWDVDSSG